MLAAMLRLQWKAARAWLIAGIVAVVALPVLSVFYRTNTPVAKPAEFLSELEVWGFGYPLLAFILGAAAARLAWRSDRRGDFVYALSLPIDQWHYTLLRFGAGAITLGVVVAALWVSAALTTVLVRLPSTMQGYAHALTFKFAVAMLAVFSLAFVLESLDSRARRGLAIAVVALLIVQVLLLVGQSQWNVITPLIETLFGRSGPLGALTGRWMLIDV